MSQYELNDLINQYCKLQYHLIYWENIPISINNQIANLTTNLKPPLLDEEFVRDLNGLAAVFTQDLQLLVRTHLSNKLEHTNRSLRQCILPDNLSLQLQTMTRYNITKYQKKVPINTISQWIKDCFHDIKGLEPLSSGSVQHASTNEGLQRASISDTSRRTNTVNSPSAVNIHDTSALSLQDTTICKLLPITSTSDDSHKTRTVHSPGKMNLSDIHAKSVQNTSNVVTSQTANIKGPPKRVELNCNTVHTEVVSSTSTVTSSMAQVLAEASTTEDDHQNELDLLFSPLSLTPNTVELLERSSGDVFNFLDIQPFVDNVERIPVVDFSVSTEADSELSLPACSSTSDKLLKVQERVNLDSNREPQSSVHEDDRRIFQADDFEPCKKVNNTIKSHFITSSFKILTHEVEGGLDINDPIIINNPALLVSPSPSPTETTWKRKLKTYKYLKNKRVRASNDLTPLPEHLRVVDHSGVEKHLWEVKLHLATHSVIIADSNLRGTKGIPEGWELHFYPGARLQHAINIIHNLPTQPNLRNLICTVGLNNREDSYIQVRPWIVQLMKIARRFPNFFCVGISYSQQLPYQLQCNVDAVNYLLCNLAEDNTVYIPPLAPEQVQLKGGDCIHHDTVTKVAILRKIYDSVYAE